MHCLWEIRPFTKTGRDLYAKFGERPKFAPESTTLSKGALSGAIAKKKFGANTAELWVFRKNNDEAHVWLQLQILDGDGNDPNSKRKLAYVLFVDERIHSFDGSDKIEVMTIPWPSAQKRVTFAVKNIMLT